MENINSLIEQYHELHKAVIEKRREIDYDMKNHLDELKKDNSLEGKLRAAQFEEGINLNEKIFEDNSKILSEMREELHPMLIEVGANSSNRKKVYLNNDNSSFIEAFIDDDNSLLVLGPISVL